MPIHDVSDGFDPSFFDEALVFRRLDDVASDGRTRRTPAWSGPETIAAVVETTAGATQRDADYQVGERTARITTDFRLRGPAPGYQPDVVVLDSAPLGSDAPLAERYAASPRSFDHYVVSELDDFSRYGAGFVTGTITLTDLQPQPPTEGP